MVNQMFALKYLEHIEQVIEEYSIQGEIQEKLHQIKEKMEIFTMKVLMIGGFSAGKSALLNTLFSKDWLIENQTPETAVATEIRYGSINKFEAFFKDGTQQEMILEDIQKLNTKDILYFLFTINNPFLRQHANFTFVDMPGFNSTIEEHNKAIMQYIGQGNAYIMVVDCEEGEIKTTGIDFIQEIRQYDNNLAIAVSKGDKKSKNDLEMIVKNIKDTAEWEFQEEIAVESVSKFDITTSSKMQKLIDSFDVQKIYEASIRPLIKELLEYVLISLKKLESTETLDISELQLQIETHAKLKKELEVTLSKERKKLTQKMQNFVLPNILMEVESALFNKSTQLASTALISENAFSRLVNNTLRPILIDATKRYTEESYTEFLQELDFDSVAIDINDMGESISAKLSDTIKTLEKIQKTTNQASTIYKVVSGVLAITTTAVAPWLELIIIFLPEILKLLGIGGQNSQRDKVKKKIENEIIPQIIEKLNSAISESLKEVEAELIEETENKVTELISIEETALKSAQQMKESQTDRYESLQKKLETTIISLQKQLNEIEDGSYVNQ